MTRHYFEAFSKYPLMFDEKDGTDSKVNSWVQPCSCKEATVIMSSPSSPNLASDIELIPRCM